MRKILLPILSSILAFVPLITVASFNHVGPAIYIQGTIDNQTPFNFYDNLKFTAYNQDISADAKNKVLYIEIPQGVIGKFYLSYINYDQWQKTERQCVFTVNAISKNNVTITEEDIPGEFISCHLSGDPKNNNLAILLKTAIPNKHKSN